MITDHQPGLLADDLSNSKTNNNRSIAGTALENTKSFYQMKSLQKSVKNPGMRSLVVYKKEKELFVKVKKSAPSIYYPKVIMPEQPFGYIKTKKHECW